MSDRFQDKYRIPSARLRNWDYGSDATYFVTICTQGRECFFGEIINNGNDAFHRVYMSAIGKIVETEWLKTPEIRPDMNLKMGEFVVMPNHFHAIIIIGENKYNTNRQCGTDYVLNHGDYNGDCGDINGDAMRDCRDAMHRVSTNKPVTTNNIVTNTEYKNTFAPQSKNLASIIRGFKSSVTINARKIDANFGWQSRFYDHIIRNEESFQRI